MTTENASTLFERIRFRGEPVAHPDATFVCAKARFTFLTARLLRLEWSESGEYEDRGTYAFPTRYTPAPPRVETRAEGDEVLFDTGDLLVRYRGNGTFSADNLSIGFRVNGERVTWRPGMPNPLNLGGTRRTLDGCEGDAALDEGLLSRAGWALFDDSVNVVFTRDDGWVAPRPDHELVDWYFIAYGHDYVRTLADYARFGGQVPLIPRFVLGAWWSRYWAYSAQDLKDLVTDFQRYDLPLDVLVIDMDWHTPHAWTGYTWNRELFPDPPAFLKWVHERGLRATLNLHPAQGVQHFEEIYPRFAEAIGVDPESEEAVPFRITDRRFVESYLTLLHHPMEEQGVDFWWIDWQQGEVSEMAGLDPLGWLNHLHFQDSTRRGRRPMLYSRWGGLGNHRYHIGFSGDTIVGWPALQFQPYFTATASNVAYGWWSHDIGGHMGGATEPELFARWVQFGALSPCLRLHSTKDPRAERRPWKYPDEVYRAARAAFHLRYQLVPYLYTMARVASDTSVSLCRPMYWAHPEQDAAYAARYQYYLGDQVIAAPIVHPADGETGLASTDVWVPEGTWIDYQTKETFAGPRWVRLVGDLERLPMLVKEGAILPLASSLHDPAGTRLRSGTTDGISYDELVLAVFPGDGSFRLYEDDGISTAYRQGQFEWTPIATRLEGQDAWTVEVGPVEGQCEALPAERCVVVHLEGSRQPQAVTVDGAGTKDWTYNPETLTTTVRVPGRDKRQALQVTAWNPNGIVALGEYHNDGVVRSDVWRLLGSEWDGDASDVDAVLGADAPGRADAVARLGGPFVRFLEYVTPREAAQQLGRAIVGGPVGEDDPYDLRATFTLFAQGDPQVHVVEREGCTGPLILDAPFGFDGEVRTMRWEAQVEISWRGETLRTRHASKPFFPAVHSWRAVVYDEDEVVLSPDQVVGEDGAIDGTLEWESYAQQADDHPNLVRPHGAFLSRQHRDRLRAGENLAAYLVATVISPDDRQAAIEYGSAGEATIYLNGEEIADRPRQGDRSGHPLRDRYLTESVHLCAGENTLLVHTRPPQEGRRFWVFGAGFVSPEDRTRLMTDLAYM